MNNFHTKTLGYFRISKRLGHGNILRLRLCLALLGALASLGFYCADLASDVLVIRDLVRLRDGVDVRLILGEEEGDHCRHRQDCLRGNTSVSFSQKRCGKK